MGWWAVACLQLFVTCYRTVNYRFPARDITYSDSHMPYLFLNCLLLFLILVFHMRNTCYSSFFIILSTPYKNGRTNWSLSEKNPVRQICWLHDMTFFPCANFLSCSQSEIILSLLEDHHHHYLSNIFTC